MGNLLLEGVHLEMKIDAGMALTENAILAIKGRPHAAAQQHVLSVIFLAHLLMLEREEVLARKFLP